MYSIEDPEKFRANVCGKLAVIVPDPTIRTNIEKGVYNYAIKEANTKKIIKKWNNPHFTQIYIDRLRTIYVNLKNPELLQQVNSNIITPQALVFMTHQEMKPERWSKLIEQKIKRLSLIHI